FVGLPGRPEARELPHGPQMAAIHAGMDAARERVLTWITEINVRIEAVQALRGVQRVNRHAAHGCRRNLSLPRRFQFTFPALTIRLIRYRRHQSPFRICSPNGATVNSQGWLTGG